MREQGFLYNAYIIIRLRYSVLCCARVPFALFVLREFQWMRYSLECISRALVLARARRVVLFLIDQLILFFLYIVRGGMR